MSEEVKTTLDFSDPYTYITRGRPRNITASGLHVLMAGASFVRRVTAEERQNYSPSGVPEANKYWKAALFEYAELVRKFTKNTKLWRTSSSDIEVELDSKAALNLSSAGHVNGAFKLETKHAALHMLYGMPLSCCGMTYISEPAIYIDDDTLSPITYREALTLMTLFIDLITLSRKSHRVIGVSADHQSAFLNLCRHELPEHINDLRPAGAGWHEMDAYKSGSTGRTITTWLYHTPWSIFKNAKL